jgi:hypothetical protein
MKPHIKGLFLIVLFPNGLSCENNSDNLTDSATEENGPLENLDPFL